MFSLAGIPFIFIWGMFTYDMLISFGMSENVAQMGQQWALVSVVACVFNGLNESFFQFSSVVDPDVHSNVIAVLMSAAQTASVSLTLYRYQYADLLHVALVKMTVIIIFIAINVIYCSCRGWLDLYWDGLMKSNALNNRVAVTQFLKTGIPLGIGAVARESEWGGLLLLASEMGPAEVSAWAIVRTFWDIFAASMEGICCAAEIRCAYHIGRGNAFMARKSSFKSMLFGAIFGISLTSIFFLVFQDEIPEWLTNDETLRNMLLSLIPVASICNVATTIGMILWSLLGAQGRYRLASLIKFLAGWVITIPLGVAFVYGLNYDLQGLVSAVTIGYSVTASVYMYLFVRTNWDKRVAKVSKTMQNAE
mmetsp:Transcript_24792/g.50145  ORF Transcript_24792/g.50145 Transcript_24792/m.50145 type:complete len:364 (+) Transcript_24792:1802-2893(+)